MTDETKLAQVGDTVLLEGLPRVVTELRGRTVAFDNPPDVPHAEFERDADGATVRDGEGKKVLVSGFPSRAGTVGMSALDLILDTGSHAIWGVRGRVEAKQAADVNAVPLIPAEFKINKPR